VLAEVEVDVSCNNLLNEFAEAFNELDGSVVFGVVDAKVDGSLNDRD